MNGWTGTPGVPLNPERDGWHWVKHGNGAIVPRFWRCDHWEGVDHSSITPLEPSEVATCWTYIRPVMCHDEAAALQARVAKLEGSLRDLIEHTLDCELELDKFHGLGNDAGAGMSDVLCKARAALERNQDAYNRSLEEAGVLIHKKIT